MRKIEVTFAPCWLESVRKTLVELEVAHGITATEVRRADRGSAHNEVYRGSIYAVPWQLDTRLEIVVTDEEADLVVKAILRLFEEDRRRGGVILVYPVADCIRIRTGERGDFAL